jgi:hypothetical protein
VAVTLAFSLALVGTGIPSRPVVAMSPARALTQSGPALYVALNGSDSGDGSIARPFRTLAHAGTVARPGTTIYVRGGVYPQVAEIVIATGTVAAPILFRPYPGEQVVLDGAGAPSSPDLSMISLHNASHVTFDGFELRNGPLMGLQVADGTDVTIRNCLIHDMQDNGLLASGQQLLIENNQVWNVVLRNANNASGRGLWGSSLHTVRRPNFMPTLNVTIRNNVVHDTWGEGIGVYHTDGAVVQGNTVYDTYSVSVYLDQARNVQIDRNYVYVTGDARNKNGLAPFRVGMATEPLAGNTQPVIMLQNITVSNNIIVAPGIGLNYYYDNGTVDPSNTYQNVHIYYNVVRAPAFSTIQFHAVQNNSLKPSGVLVRNNILDGATMSANNTLQIGDIAGWTFSNNDWPNGVPGPAREPTSFAADPLFANPVAGGPADGFRLQAGSPAIGKATPLGEVTLDFFGTPRDPAHPSIGVHEYAAGPATLTPTSTTSPATTVPTATFTLTATLTPTPPPTATLPPSLSPTTTLTPNPCMAGVGVAVAPDGSARLRVTITARTSVLADVRLVADPRVPNPNALFDVPNGASGAGTLSVQPGTPQLVFYLRPAVATQAVTAPLAIADGCGGQWTTLIGAGPAAVAGPAGPATDVPVTRLAAPAGPTTTASTRSTATPGRGRQ